MMVHRLLKRQIKKCTESTSLDSEELCDLISKSYEENENIHRLAGQTNKTLETEVMSLN